MMSLREDIEHISRFCEVCFDKVGEIRGLWEITSADGQHMLVPNPPGDKDDVNLIFRELFKEWQVIRYVYVCEAWAVETNSLHEAERAALEGCDKHPHRVEKIVITAEDHLEGMMTASRTIIRNGKHAALGPLEINNRSGRVMGRMVDMLPRVAGHA